MKNDHRIFSLDPSPARVRPLRRQRILFRPTPDAKVNS
jgi:hypothetical protein